MKKIKYILVILGVISLETIVIKNNKYELCVLPPLVAMLALQGVSISINLAILLALGCFILYNVRFIKPLLELHLT